ncbi:glucosaminidase domain-containing protein [Romboutsia lituseburensis]|nr:glucosaminidase domain-containing protein [Romboutsia lituseburensis]
MNLSKKVISLICLTSLMLGFNSSSKSSLAYNDSNLCSIDFDYYSKNTVIEQTIVKSSTSINVDNSQREQILLKEKEKIRKQSVDYSRDDMTLVSGITEKELNNVFMNYTGASTMAHLSGAIVDAEKKYGVNAFTMAAIVALESGFATSRRAVEDNNLTGYEVYSDDSDGHLFSSQYESVVQTARHLSKNYLSKSGPYYLGVAVDDVQINYCPDEGKGKNWDGKVDKLASGFLKTYKNLYLK